MRRFAIVIATLYLSHGLALQESQEQVDIQTVQFRWTTADPVLGPPKPTGEPAYSLKEPSIVFFDNRWHLFCSLRGKENSRRIKYLTFTDWAELGSVSSTPLELTNEPVGTPQVFYYSPQKLWYLVYHLHRDDERQVAPMFSTSRNIARPSEWSPPTALRIQRPEGIKAWADFWIICDEIQAHLFFTSNDGRIWRAETSHDEFPSGWAEPEVVIRGDFIGAPHVYRIQGTTGYLALVEAHRQWRRYYKAYLSQSLKGPWKPLAVTRTRPFASLANVDFTGAPWTDSFGHGELIRSGHDERLEVELKGLRFLYQGSSYADREGRLPREVPWRLGILMEDKK